MFTLIYSFFSSSWNFEFDYLMSTLAQLDYMYEVSMVVSSIKVLKTFDFYLSCCYINFREIYDSPELFYFAF